jgi:hypothetical protein
MQSLAGATRRDLHWARAGGLAVDTDAPSPSSTYRNE